MRDVHAPTLLPAMDRRAQPWKNGGGVSWDVLVSRPDLGGEAFDWRISIAEIAAAGPFSVYEHVDRLFMPLSTGGVVLRIGGRRSLVDQYQTIVFAGEDAVEAVEVEGATLDLNVMVRRGRATAHLSIVESRGKDLVIGGSDARQVLIALDEGPRRGNVGSLARLDAVLVPPRSGYTFRGGDRLALIAISESPRPMA